MSDPDRPHAAMASGSGAGEPGGHLGPGDLSPEERRLLQELERDGASADHRGDDDERMARAAEDEAPLPGEGGDQGDGLSARFSSPPGD